MESERPAGLSGEELEQYDILLEEQAYPFEEKSINIHETNVGRISAGTYDEWVKKCKRELEWIKNGTDETNASICRNCIFPKFYRRV